MNDTTESPVSVRTTHTFADCDGNVEAVECSDDTKWARDDGVGFCVWGR